MACFATRVRIAAVMLALLGVNAAAHAAPTRIVCKGSNHLNWTTGAIVMELNDSTQTVTLISSDSGILQPHPAQTQLALQVTRYDSTEIDFQVTYSDPDGSTWMDTARINRTTGEFTDINNQAGPRHVYIYSGTCTKAEQQF